jgi:hypothetical protein
VCVVCEEKRDTALHLWAAEHAGSGRVRQLHNERHRVVVEVLEHLLHKLVHILYFHQRLRQRAWEWKKKKKEKRVYACVPLR